MKFTEIQNAIYNKLNSITELVKVYKYHAADSSGEFPFSTFEPSDVEADYLSNAENIRTYGFRVLIHQEIETVGREKALSILMNSADSVIDAFDSDYTLGEVVTNIKAVPANFGIYSEGSGLVAYAEIKLLCQTIINI